MRFFLYPIFFLLLLFSILTLSIHFPPVQNFLKNRLKSFLENATGTKVSIGWISWNPILNQIHIGDLALFEEGELPYLELPFLSIQIPWWGLQGSRLIVEKIEIFSPTFRFHEKGEGKIYPFYHLTSLQESSRKTSSLAVEIREIEVFSLKFSGNLSVPTIHIQGNFNKLQVKKTGGGYKGTWKDLSSSLFLIHWNYPSLKSSGEFTFGEEKGFSFTLHSASPQFDLAIEGTFPENEDFLTLTGNGVANLNLINELYTPFPTFLGTALLKWEMAVKRSGEVDLKTWVSSESLLVEGNLVENLFIEGVLHPRGIRFPKISFQSNGGKVEGDGSVIWEPELKTSWNLTLSRFPLSAGESFLYPLPLDAKGYFSGNLTFSIGIEPVFYGLFSGTGKLHSLSLSLLPSHPWENLSPSLTFSFSLKKDRITLEKVSFSEQDYQGTVSGIVPFSGSPTLEGEVETSSIELFLKDTLPISGDGKIFFQYTPEEISITGRSEKGKFAFIPLKRAEYTIKILESENAVIIKNIETELPQGTISGFGRYEISEKRYTLTLALKNASFPLGTNQVKIAHATGEIKISGVEEYFPTFSGEVSGNLSLPYLSYIPFTLKSRSPYGEMDFSTLLQGKLHIYNTQFLTSLSGTLLFTPERYPLFLPAPLTVTVSSTCITLNLSSCSLFTHLYGGGLTPTTLFLTYTKEGLRIAGRWGENTFSAKEAREGFQFLFALNYSSEEGISWDWGKILKIEGEGTLFFPRKEWKKMDGEIVLSSLAGEYRSFFLSLSSPTKIYVEKGTFSFARAKVFIDGKENQISGTFTPERDMDLSLTIHLPLKIVRTFLPDLPIEGGEIYGNLQIQGEEKNPSFSGRLFVREGVLKISGMEERITKGEGTLSFSGRTLSLTDLSATFGAGTIKGEGEISFPQLGTPYGFIAGEIKTNLVNFRPYLSCGLDGKVTLHWKKEEAPLLSGEIRLTSLRYEREIPWEGYFLRIRRYTSLPEEGEGSPLRLNLHIYGGEKIYLLSNLFDIRGKVDLKVRGSFRKPQITGTFLIYPGSTLFFREKQYTFQRGIIRLLEGEKLFPFLDLETETLVRETLTQSTYRIRMFLYGPWNQIQIRFLSEPPLPEVDVLTLLTFGVLSKNFGSSGKEVASTSGVELAHLFLSGSIGRLEKELKEVTRMDLFSLQPYYVSSLGSSTTMLIMEKRLGENILLRTGTTLETSLEQRIELSYAFSSRFRLVGGWENRRNSQSGFSLRPRLYFPLP